MNKLQVARVLEEIARFLELSEPNRFKALAFERAARRIEALDADIVDLVRSGELHQTPGIGKSIGPIVTEIVDTGTSRYLEELRQQYPAGIFELLRVPHLGLKKIGILHEKLGIGGLDELESACRAGKLTTLRGFGAKTQAKILDGIERARRNESKFLLPVGVEVGELVRGRLATIAEVEDAEIAGAVRRRLEVITNVEIVVSTRAPEKVIDAVRSRGLLDAVEADGDTIRGTVRNEMVRSAPRSSSPPAAKRSSRRSERFPTSVRRKTYSRKRGSPTYIPSGARAATIWRASAAERSSSRPTFEARSMSTRRFPTAATRSSRCSTPPATATSSTSASPITRRPRTTPVA